MPESIAHPEAVGYPTTVMEWFALACKGSVVRRGLTFAVVVGAILIAINHGDAILAGELTRTNYYKMALTVVVPYVVSALSSVGAMVDCARRAERLEAESVRAG